VKQGLALLGGGTAGHGITVLIYHRVGGGTSDELDVPTAAFTAQMDLLAGGAASRAISLDEAADRLERGDRTPGTVITFDDGFADVHTRAWPVLAERGLPFTVYLTAGLVGGPMSWSGSTAKDTGAPGLSWKQLAEMNESGLCGIGNHTLSHARPEALSIAELDGCTEQIAQHLGVRPAHFAYTWGRPVPHMEPALRQRFRTAATGRVGRNRPGCDPMLLARVPVRRTDPPAFFRAKLGGTLLPELAYARIVSGAKAVGARA
jgi:peptidoglycan/xylan/chitin deacetylase (PgdA/CDA1 family)